MQFNKYQHVERIGTSEVDGLLEGMCYVFPKIDGTNASVWLCPDNGLQAGSRNRHLEIDNDNAGFLAAMLENENTKSFLKSNPDKRLFGEWLVPHSLKTYREETWRRFYVFDVMCDDEYMRYEDYQPLLEEHGVEYIPPLFVVERPTEERLYNSLKENNYLIEDGKGTGEGVVVKNYDFVNRFGRTTWGKIVSSEFKAKHTKALGPREVKEKSRVEDAIAAEFVTEAIVEKVYAKIVNEGGGWSSRDIPKLLNIVYYDVVREEIWQIVKQFKNPTIDFKKLQNAVFAHTKVYKPELF